jgi:hypothetical protein
MTQLFGQLGFVSAILAGFAFTFMAGLLTSPSSSRAYSWVFVSALVAALSLMIAAVGSVFAGLGVEGNFLDSTRIRNLLAVVSQAFLIGVLSLVLSAGCSGWLRSRRLGIISSVLAGISTLVFATIVLPFLKLQ